MSQAISTNEQILEKLSQFKLAKFFAVYEVGEKGLHLPPYKGSTFRGGFGSVFRKVACTCPKNERNQTNEHLPYCPYAYIFETTAPDGAKILQNNENIPRPFLLEPPEDKRTYYAPGERFTVGFTLFGEAIKYFPYFAYVFDEMGKQGFGRNRHQAELRQIFAVDTNEDWQDSLFQVKDRTIQKEFPIITGKDMLQQNHQPLTDSRLTLHFVTPTRMKFEGHLVSEPQFHIILRNAVRRVTSLLYFHNDQDKLDMDFPSFFESATKIELVTHDTSWVDWQRYSNRQKERLKIGGIIGKAEYAGDVQAFLPWLELAEWLNIGKNSVFGLGKIKHVITDAKNL